MTNVIEQDLAHDQVRDATATAVPAAKLHVLALAPLKAKLGTRWPDLSQLVHKLFETSIARAQGPSDSCIVLDELSYALVFRDLSLTHTNLLCDSIAREVCEALFGDQIDEVSVRSVVAEIVVPPGGITAETGKWIEELVERNGTENVVTQSVHSEPPGSVTKVTSNALKPIGSAFDRIDAAHALLAEHGLRVGLFPVWELQRRLSSSLFLSPFAGGTDHLTASGRPALGVLDDKHIAEIEITLLNAAGAYAERVQEDHKVCAVGTGVSFETLSGFHSRIKFITALQKLKLQPSSPLILKIEQIPVGTPAVRLGDLAAMLKLPNVRVTLGFQSLRAIPKFDFRLNASGIGGGLPKDIDRDSAVGFVRALIGAAIMQKAFVFLDQLDTPDLVMLACQNHVRFGTGTGLGTRHFSGLEGVPQLPLTLDSSG